MEENILHQIYFAHDYLTKLEATPRDYGTDEKLFSSEIHTVDAVVANPGINLTQLAEYINVSKAAVSKFTAKMIKRGYIEKRRSGDNQKEVLFYGTEKGKTAANGHKIFEKETFGPLLQIEKDLSDEHREVILRYMQNLKAIIEK